MPQRRGIFRRIFDFVRGAPEAARQPPQQSPPSASEPPESIRESQRRAAASHERNMQRIYTNIKRAAHDPETLTDYPEWRETFNHFQVIFDDEEEIEGGWDEYLRAYYLTSGEAGHVDRDEFHNNTGIPRSEIDWELWRAIKRGTT